MLDDSIFLSNVEITRLRKQLDTLKQQYARSVVYAYKNKSTYDYLNFIFSSSNFNDALKRIAYLKSYRNYREEQVANIIEKAAADKRAADKAAADKAAAAKNPKPNEKEAAPEKKEEVVSITANTSKPDSYLNLNAKDIALNKGFEENKGRLPWPVDNGLVSIHYGTYKIPGTQLSGDNAGLTIATPSAGSNVKSVFNGEVSAVHNLGDGLAVIIRHGKYLF